MSVFDSIRTWVNIAPDTPTPITFEDDEPFKIGKDSYQNNQYIYNVNGDQMLAISSDPLMRVLKPHTPLEGKTVVITRTGKLRETRYTAEVVE